MKRSECTASLTVDRSSGIQVRHVTQRPGLEFDRVVLAGYVRLGMLESPSSPGLFALLSCNGLGRPNSASRKDVLRRIVGELLVGTDHSLRRSVKLG